MTTEDITVYVTLKNLIKAGGKSYRTVLEDLIKAGVIKSFEDVIALRIEKSKALHIEAVLEGFYEAPVDASFSLLKPKGDK